ncbi:hypothetical protein ROZALSC1DRAFT_26631 [Rozella allomycis CSF55]|uniref:Uncharacterized protein n=1 Tax=Rozella allomycis (strain CSF55) TaxID=988480 RepID=A0A4P9YQL6_ROZAC|nr:hypothetical protein ROZALSC1DRAFT_26631 [Rozella allomycis CSF55]
MAEKTYSVSSDTIIDNLFNFINTLKTDKCESTEESKGSYMETGDQLTVKLFQDLNQLDANDFRTKSLLKWIQLFEEMLDRNVQSKLRHLEEVMKKDDKIHITTPCLTYLLYEKLTEARIELGSDLLWTLAMNFRNRMETERAWNILQRIPYKKWTFSMIRAGIEWSMEKSPQDLEKAEEIYREFIDSSNHNEGGIDKKLLKYWYSSMSLQVKWKEMMRLYEEAKLNTLDSEHLALDNAIMDVSLNYGQYEYAWKVYESIKQMDRNTARIVATLCRCAFFSDKSPDAKMAMALSLKSAKEYLEEKTRWEARAWAFYSRFVLQDIKEMEGSIVYILHQLLEIVADSLEPGSRFAKVNRIYNQLKASFYRNKSSDGYLISPILRLCVKCIKDCTKEHVGDCESGSQSNNNGSENKPSSNQEVVSPLILNPDAEHGDEFFKRAFEIYEDAVSSPPPTPSRKSTRSIAIRKRSTKSMHPPLPSIIHNQLQLPDVECSPTAENFTKNLGPQTYTMLLELCMMKQDVSKFDKVCQDLKASGIDLNQHLLADLQSLHDQLIAIEEEQEQSGENDNNESSYSTQPIKNRMSLKVVTNFSLAIASLQAPKEKQVEIG